MANRIVLNNISYHGKGAIQEIVSEVKSNLSLIHISEPTRRS